MTEIIKKHIGEEIEEITNTFSSGDISFLFRERIKKGGLTKADNQESHFCVYFAAYDSKAREFFLGHHKKSGLWLFNGGHLERGEAMNEALDREIGEEWGLSSKDFKIPNPGLLTITEIYNPMKQPCRTHFDIWYFIDVVKARFNPNPDNLAEEFYATEWMNMEKAKEVVIDRSTLLALDLITADLTS